MDPAVIGVFIPLTGVVGGMAIAVAAVIMSGKRKIAELQVEEAKLRLGAGEEGVAEAIEDLREEVGHLRSEMVEFHERIEFTERLLSQAKERDGLPPGSSE